MTIDALCEIFGCLTEVEVAVVGGEADVLAIGMNWGSRALLLVSGHDDDSIISFLLFASILIEEIEHFSL